MTTTTLLAGASGYAFKEWKGSFYPQDLPADGMLAFYAARLPSVEINNTFYAMPKATVLAHWVETTPQTFRFSIKASRKPACSMPSTSLRDSPAPTRRSSRATARS